MKLEDIPPGKAAGYVLHRLAPPDVEVPGMEPGGFYAALIDAACKADRVHLARLGLSFPALASAVETYKYDPHGVEKLIEAYDLWITAGAPE